MSPSLVHSTSFYWNDCNADGNTHCRQHRTGEPKKDGIKTQREGLEQMLKGPEEPVQCVLVLENTGLSLRSTQAGRELQARLTCCWAQSKRTSRRPCTTGLRVFKLRIQLINCLTEDFLFLHPDEYTSIMTWKGRLEFRILSVLRDGNTARSGPQPWHGVTVLLSW